MRHLVPLALRRHDADAWAALVSGANDLAANPIEGEDHLADQPCILCGEPFHQCECYCGGAMSPRDHANWLAEKASEDEHVDDLDGREFSD